MKCFVELEHTLRLQHEQASGCSNTVSFLCWYRRSRGFSSHPTVVCDCEGIISQECLFLYTFPVLFCLFFLFCFAFWNCYMFLLPMPPVVSSVLSHLLGLKAHKIWLYQPHSVECDTVCLSLLQWAELVWRIYLDHIILSPSTVFKMYFYLFEKRGRWTWNEHSGTCLNVFYLLAFFTLAFLHLQTNAALLLSQVAAFFCLKPITW